MNSLVGFLIVLIIFFCLLIIYPLVKIIKILKFKRNISDYIVTSAELFDTERTVRHSNYRMHYIYRGIYAFTSLDGIEHKFHDKHYFLLTEIKNSMTVYYNKENSSEFYPESYVKSLGINILFLIFGIIIVLLMAFALYLQFC